MPISLEGDLTLSVDGEALSVHAEGGSLFVDIEKLPQAFTGQSPLTLIQPLAALLQSFGLTVHLRRNGELLALIGATAKPLPLFGFPFEIRSYSGLAALGFKSLQQPQRLSGTM